MDFPAGEAATVGVETGGDCPSPTGVRVGTEVLVAVPIGRGMAEGVEPSRAGDVVVELGSGAEVDAAVAVGVGDCVDVGAGSNECSVTSSM